MSMLTQIISQEVGNESAIKLIEEGDVKINGIIDKSDQMLNCYDIIEFVDKKVCYVGGNYYIVQKNDLLQ